MKTIQKHCNRCNQELPHEWYVDKEIPEEPIFFLVCLGCGAMEQAEVMLK
jgi:hypothetical protein